MRGLHEDGTQPKQQSNTQSAAEHARLYAQPNDARGAYMSHNVCKSTVAPHPRPSAVGSAPGRRSIEPGSELRTLPVVVERLGAEGPSARSLLAQDLRLLHGQHINHYRQPAPLQSGLDGALERLSEHGIRVGRRESRAPVGDLKAPLTHNLPFLPGSLSSRLDRDAVLFLELS